MISLEPINRKYVLDRITQEAIFEKYMNVSIDYKKTYKNPLRDDKDGSCKFYISESKILYLKDWSWRSFDCFSFVEHYYYIEFKMAIYKICYDFNLTEINKLPVASEGIKNLSSIVKPVVFSFDIKDFDKNTLSFWKKYISWITPEILNKYGVFVLYKYYKDGELKFTNNKEQRYVYILGEFKYQMYSPHEKQFKFLTTGTRVVGLKSIDYSKEYILIIKSIKDWVLSRLLGLNTIGLISEGASLTSEALDVIDKFPYCLTLFDRDRAGKKASIKFKKEYSTIPLLFPEDLEKDLSDNLEEYGENDIWELIVETADRMNLKI